MSYTKLLYRPEIDGLRAVAVFSVVLFHFFPIILPNGFLGVDIFFVISGFLITSQLINYNQSFFLSLKIFYIRRIKRLFPALFVFLTITSIFISYFYLKIDFERFKDSLIASYSFWANIYFWRDGGYFGGDNQLKPLLHIWSLSVEEQFYLLFPGFLLIFLKFKNISKIPAILPVFIITILSFFLWVYMHKIDGKSPAFFLLPTRTWQFGLGSLLALINVSKFFTSFSNVTNKILFILSNIIIFVALISKLFDRQILTIIISIGAFGFIAFSSSQNNLFINFFKSRIATFLGKISYSLYLYHWPIASILNYYFVDKISIFFSILGILFSLIFANLSFVFIENNFRNRLSFKYCIMLLFGCLLFNFSTNFLIKNDLNPSLANSWSIAKCKHFRCELSSYRPYGASKACKIKNAEKSEEVVVLIGNSHAQMYAPLVSENIPNNLNLLLVPLNSCLPTTTINISQKCLEMARTNLNSVLEDDNVKTVIISTTWYSDSYIDVYNNKLNKSSLKKSITELIKEIQNKDKSVILFSPIPYPGKDLANELPRKLKFGFLTEEQAVQELKILRSAYNIYFNDINSYFEKILGEKYIKVFNDLCDEVYCYYGNKQMLYFSDQNHIWSGALGQLYNSKKQLRSFFFK